MLCDSVYRAVRRYRSREEGFRRVARRVGYSPGTVKWLYWAGHGRVTGAYWVTVGDAVQELLDAGIPAKEAYEEVARRFDILPSSARKVHWLVYKAGTRRRTRMLALEKRLMDLASSYYPDSVPQALIETAAAETGVGYGTALATLAKVARAKRAEWFLAEKDSEIDRLQRELDGLRAERNSLKKRLEAVRRIASDGAM